MRLLGVGLRWLLCLPPISDRGELLVKPSNGSVPHSHYTTSVEMPPGRNLTNKPSQGDMKKPYGGS